MHTIFSFRSLKCTMKYSLLKSQRSFSFLTTNKYPNRFGFDFTAQVIQNINGFYKNGKSEINHSMKKEACQIVPGFSRFCHKNSGFYESCKIGEGFCRNCQNILEFNKSCQSTEGYSRCCKIAEGFCESCKIGEGLWRFCKKSYGFQRICQNSLGFQRIREKSLGFQRISQKSSGFQRFCQTRSISVVPARSSIGGTGYAMPTVTWGPMAEQTKLEQSKGEIVKYLRNVGFMTDEIEELELPSSMEVMKERVEFLQGIGLSIEDINEYPRMLCCSVKKNIMPVLGFLDYLGLEKQDFAPLIRRYPYILFASILLELVPVIKTLRAIGVQREEIPSILTRYPELLGFRIEGTISTTIAYLVSIGVEPRNICKLVSDFPWILGMRVGTMIKPKVDYLVSIGFPKGSVAKIIERQPHFVKLDLKTMKHSVDQLISIGVRQERIAMVVAQYVELLQKDPGPGLSSKNAFLSSEINVSKDDFISIIEKLPQVISLPDSLIVKRIDFLRGRSFRPEDITKMVVECPQLLVLPIEQLKQNYYFFKTEIKMPLQELVDFPYYFTYSLDDRIRPRFEQLSNKGIDLSLGSFLNCSDRKFREIVISDGLGVADVSLSFRMGGSLKSPFVEEEQRSSDKLDLVEDDGSEESKYTRTIIVQRE